MTLDEKKIFYARQIQEGNASGIANFDGFISAHNLEYCGYATALQEIKAGQKTNHWIWYIFPQIAGIPGAHSDNALRYALSGELQAYLYMQTPILREHMFEILQALLEHKGKTNIFTIMGSRIDAMKLRSSMTLFWIATQEQIFLDVINAFYGENAFCQKTVDIIRNQRNG